jgi:hypothetical protein
VRGIDAHHQRALPHLGEAQAGCRGQTGFTNSAFSAEQEDPHGFRVTRGHA